MAMNKKSFFWGIVTDIVQVLQVLGNAALATEAYSYRQ